jgi:hypothetical protein
MELNEDEETIVPGNRRKMQKRRSRRRELFGPRKKEAFLEALSCSANVTAAAEAAGVVTATVYNHRRKDAEFRELWWVALEQGVAKLVALRLQREIERAEGRPSTLRLRSGEPSLGTSGLDVQLDGPPDARQIADLYKLVGLLREHARGLSGEGKAGRPPEKASMEEACKVLAKRLKAFHAREAKRAA